MATVIVVGERGSVHLSFDPACWTSSTGTEVDEYIIIDGGAEKVLQGFGDERGGGSVLEGPETFGPEEG